MAERLYLEDQSQLERNRKRNRERAARRGYDAGHDGGAREDVA